MGRNWPNKVGSSSGANNPKGIATSSPRLRGTSYLGKRRSKMTTATRLRSCLAGHVQSQTYFSSHSISCLRKSAQLILKTHLTMMLLLIGDVLPHLFEIRLADAKV